MATVVSASHLDLRNEQDIVRCRQAVRKAAQEHGFGLVDQTKLVTAASELARNTVTHGRGGEATLEVLVDGVRKGIRLCFSDNGPGLPDIALAMTDGWSSGNGMGLGLSGSKRLSSEFDLASSPGEGTRVTITRWT